MMTNSCSALGAILENVESTLLRHLLIPGIGEIPFSVCNTPWLLAPYNGCFQVQGFPMSIQF